MQTRVIAVVHIVQYYGVRRDKFGNVKPVLPGGSVVTEENFHSTSGVYRADGAPPPGSSIWPRSQAGTFCASGARAHASLPQPRSRRSLYFLLLHYAISAASGFCSKVAASALALAAAREPASA